MSKKLLFSFILLSLISALLLIGGYFYYSQQLPNVNELKNYQLQTPLRIYSSDNKLIAEYGEKRRILINFVDIPSLLISAFICAEDTDFYQNKGINFASLLRSAWQIITTGHIHSGGSTITMQVARNFFLNSKKVFSRKLKEILLALQINHYLSKQEIMELYLNKIYLGNRAYGIQAASYIYYGKPVNELTLAEMAMIAGLPKAPSIFNPIANPKRSLQRRNWILSRMLKLKYINQNTFMEAVSQPVTANYHATAIELHAPHIAEMVRQEMVNRYGYKAYLQGFKVYTTINSHNQNTALQAVKYGLLSYEHRYGYRGPIKNIGNDKITWVSTLEKTPEVSGLMPAIVTEVTTQKIHILLKNKQTGVILRPSMSWVQKKNQKITLANGDLIFVLPDKNNYQLAQISEAQVALIAMNPETGAIKALIGGNGSHSYFNRATQAFRQIGSAIKPFIYSAALNHGMTAASLINDAPVITDYNLTGKVWRPHNNDSKFNGLMTLRQGLYQSKNLISIRILQKIGIKSTLQYLQQIGLPINQLPNYLSLALGTAEMTPLQLSTNYAMLANGGYQIKPYFIEKIIYHDHPTFIAEPASMCATDTKTSINQAINSILPMLSEFPFISKINCAPQVMSPQINFIINNILEDVIKKGTAKKARQLKRSDLAGKTGTTNNHKDSWFIGYNQKLLTTVWVGKDNATSLGNQEYGSTVALSIWINYMKTALKNIPQIQRHLPSGIVTVKIDNKTGQYTSNEQNSHFEIFREQFAPQIHTTNQKTLNSQMDEIY